MKLKQIVSRADVIAGWTFEDVSQDQSQIYDNSGNNITLDNFGLDIQPGQWNKNFSSKSASFNGYASHADPLFLENNIDQMNINFVCTFRVDDGQPVGLQTIVSKWGIGQQFWFGFENSLLTLKIQATDGLRTYSVASNINNYIAYNNIEDIWHTVYVSISSSSVYMSLNGVAVVNAADSIVISPSSVTALTIGSINEINTQLRISDLYFLNKNLGSIFGQAIKKLTTSRVDIIKSFNPAHYFQIADDYVSNGSLHFENKGYKKDENPIGVAVNYDNAGINWDVYDGTYYQQQAIKTNYTDRKYLKFNSYKWFTILNDMTFNFLNGVSVAWTGYWSIPGTTAYRDGDNTNGQAAVLRWYENVTGNIWKFGSDNKNYDGTTATGGTERVFTEHYNSVGTRYSQLGIWANDYNMVNQWYPGLEVIKWYNGASNWVRFQYDTYDTMSSGPYYYSGITSTSLTTPYTPPKIGWNRFFEQSLSGNDAHFGVHDLMIFEYDFTDDFARMVNVDKAVVFHELVNSAITQAQHSCPFTSRSGAQWDDLGTYAITSNSSTNDIVKDPNGNYPFNQIHDSIGAVHINGTGSYVGFDDSDPWNETFVSHFWIWNLDDSTRAPIYYVQNEYETTFDDNDNYALFINSYQGQHSPGSIEFSTYGSVYNEKMWISAQNVLTTSGFHSITIRKASALNYELWVDGVVVASKAMEHQTSSGDVYDNSAGWSWQFNGTNANFYIKSYFYWNGALTNDEIEFLNAGWNEIVTGVTQLNQVAVQSRLALVDHSNGITTRIDSTETDGTFSLSLDKATPEIDLVSLPLDPGVTNHVISHGPYASNSYDTSKYVEYQRSYFDTVYEAIEETSPWGLWRFDPDYEYGGIPAEQLLPNIPNLGTGGSAWNAYLISNYVYNQSQDDVTFKSVYLNGTGSSTDINTGSLIRWPNSILPTGLTASAANKGSDGITMNFFVKILDTGWNGIWMSTSRNDGHDNFDYRYLIRNVHSQLTMVSNNSGTDYDPNGTYTNIGHIKDPSGTIRGPGAPYYTWGLLSIRHRTSGLVEAFLNGTKLENTPTITYPNFANLTYNVFGFSQYASSTYGTQCYVGQIFFHDYLLSSEDMRRIGAIGTKAFTFRSLEQLIIADSPVAYWRFDRTDGLDARIGNTANVPWAFTTNQTPAVIEYGARVLSIGEYLTNSDFEFATSSSLSVEFIFKRGGSLENGTILVGDWNQSLSQGVFKFMLTNSGELELHIVSENTKISTTTLSYNDSSWHHIAFTYDIQSTLLTLYADGSSVGTLISSLPLTNSTGVLSVCSDAVQTSSTLLANAEIRIDDLALYNSLLDATTIAERYAQMQEKKEFI